MATTKVKCAYCGKFSQKESGAINRAKRNGLKTYCNRVCSGFGRRIEKSIEQKKDEKRLYDMEYRDKNIEMLKKKKHDYNQRTYNPQKEAIKRKAKMPRHLEYCRQPEYKKWKKEYDKKFRSKKYYHEFWESFLLLMDIEKEIETRITRTEVYTQNGTLNKKLNRRRDYERLISN